MAVSTIIGANTKDYISTLNFLDKRDYLNQVLDISNESSTIVDMLEMTDRVKNTDAPEFTHVENTYLFRAAVISSISGGATAGATMTVTIVDNTTPSELDWVPVVGELVMFQTKAVAIVNSVTNLSFVCTPVLSTVTLATGVAATQSVVFFSQASAEGTDDPSTRQSAWQQSKNYVQIFKEAGEITDLQKVSAVEVVYNGKPYIMYKVQHDAYLRHKMKISNALLFGVKGVNTDNTNWGGKVYTTQGLRSYILSGDGGTKTTGGIDKTYTAGSLDKAALKDFNRKLDKNQAPDDYMGYIGGDLYAEIDDLLAAADGVKYSLNFAAFGQGDAKKRAIDLGFESFRIYGRTFHLNKLKVLDHKGLFGATGFTFGNEGYFIPTDKIKVDHGGGTSDRILMRVMSGDGTNFYPHMENVTGKLAPNATNTKSVLHVSYQTIAGLQVCGTDHFGIIRSV